MNIIEAIKSGKAFKRAIWTRDYVRPPFMNLNLSAEELVADDWEVEEKKVTITAEQLEIAFIAALKPDALASSFYNILEELKKELGL